MRSPFVPAPPGGPPAPTRDADPDGAARRVRCTFLVVNAVPFAVGVVLSCSTSLSGVQVYGRLSLGFVWGSLQLGVFLAAVGWYEARSRRLCGPGDPYLPSGRPSGPASACSARESGR